MLSFINSLKIASTQQFTDIVKKGGQQYRAVFSAPLTFLASTRNSISSKVVYGCSPLFLPSIIQFIDDKS